MKIENMKVGKTNLLNGIPADFIAVSSECSPKLPKHIKVANSMARGRAVGTVIKEKYRNNFEKTSNPRFFPMKSSKYIIKNRIKKINTTTAVVKMNGPTNDFKNNLSIFLIKVDF